MERAQQTSGEQMLLPARPAVRYCVFGFILNFDYLNYVCITYNELLKCLHEFVVCYHRYF